MCLNACVRAICLTVRHSGYSIIWDATWHAAEARESTVLVDTRISPPAAVICRKSKELQCHDAAVESTKHSACVKPVYSCLFAICLFILTLRDLVVTLSTIRFIIHKSFILPTQCIYVFCVDLRTNSDFFPLYSIN